MSKEDAGIVNREKYAYQRTTVSDANGKKIAGTSNGDAVARAMFGMKRDAVNKTMRANGFGPWVKESDRLNAGQHKMVASNMLRATVRKGEQVEIAGFAISKLDQSKPKFEEAAEVNAPAKRKARK